LGVLRKGSDTTELVHEILRAIEKETGERV